jgi:hypothetical protein
LALTAFLSRIKSGLAITASRINALRLTSLFASKAALALAASRTSTAPLALAANSSLGTRQQPWRSQLFSFAPTAALALADFLAKNSFSDRSFFISQQQQLFSHHQ